MATEFVHDLATNARIILTRAGCSVESMPRVVQGLCDYYHSATRHYHGSGHITDLLFAAERIGWAWNTQLLFAVLFHDVYYEIGLKSGRNEALSARMAYDVAKTCYAFDEGDCMAIRNAVNHTANFMHRIDGISELDQMISELDLSSLAREQRNDFTYQQLGIAAEQKECDPADLDREQCLKGSGAFLKAMLESRGGRIYYTQEADAIWGDKAVENIKALANEYPV